MARRQFQVIDVVEILQHWQAGRPKAVVAQSLDLDPKTVRKYVAPAEAEGLGPGTPALSRAEWAMRVAEWFPELTDPRARSKKFEMIDAHRERIETMLETNTVTTVHQRLRDEHGVSVGITSFRHYVAQEFAEQVRRDQVTVLRPEVPAAEEAQVDYGRMGRWLDPASQKLRTVWAFVMVLTFSRHMFVRPVLKMDQVAWTACHVAAFEFFGGVVARVVPDNLGTGVTTPDLYDPKINRSFAELADYYGFLVDPARRAKPKDKPRVERPMPYVRDSWFKGREWYSEAHMQADAVRWSTEVAGRRHHRGLEGAQPIVLFQAAERDLLAALPPEPFELARWSTPKLGPDCHVKVGRALYSAPWRFIGQRLDAKETERTVELFKDGQLIKTWVRIERGRQTDWEDYPPEKVAFFMRTPTWCRRRAAELGPSVVTVVDVLLEVNALHRLRSAQGVLTLAERHGPERLEAACARALSATDPTYQTVKGILRARTEHDDEDAVGCVVAPAHLHGPDGLFNSEASVS
jgi:transposase